MNTPESDRIIKEFTTYIADDRIVDKPLVSVLMWTYNHAGYIRQSLDSVLVQMTDFDFELVVSDDASDDGTSEILLDYQRRHPHRIRLVLSKKNLWTEKVITQRLLGENRGPYFALTHGDDYWTDAHKLQKQVDAMERHPQCEICFHPAMETYVDNSLKDCLICAHADEECVFAVNDVILGGGGFMPTASLMIKRQVLATLPSWYGEVPAGDTFLQDYAARAAGALFIPDVMAVYRRFVPGSWSEEVEKSRQPTNLLNGYIHYYTLMKADFPKHTQMLDFRIAFYCKQLQINEAKEKARS